MEIGTNWDCVIPDKEGPVPFIYSAGFYILLSFEYDVDPMLPKHRIHARLYNCFRSPCFTLLSFLNMTWIRCSLNTGPTPWSIIASALPSLPFLNIKFSCNIPVRKPRFYLLRGFYYLWTKNVYSTKYNYSKRFMV